MAAIPVEFPVFHPKRRVLFLQTEQSLVWNVRFESAAALCVPLRTAAESGADVVGAHHLAPEVIQNVVKQHLHGKSREKPTQHDEFGNGKCLSMGGIVFCN